MRKLAIISIILLLFCSCERMEQAPELQDGQVINVPIELFIQEQDLSKAVNDPASITKVSDVIKNIWIIQFNGTSDDSKILGEPTYIEDFETWYALSDEEKKIELIATSKPCSIFFIANTFEGVGVFPAHQGSTIADLKNRKRLISSENDIFGAKSEDLFHPMFNGSISPDKIDASVTSLTGVLKRNVAKVNITVKNEAPANEGISIKSMQICAVPDVSFYVTNTADVVVPFPDMTKYGVINYSEVEWSGESSQTLTAYVPVNMRGKSNATTQSQKNQYAINGATYLVIAATYAEDGVEYPITYTFFLGENMINDYNLKPNASYNFTFAIKGKGDAESDYRIDDWGLVDFTDTEKYELSNCYILNPIPTGSFMRHFRIPIDRTKEFWGDGITNNYENVSNNSLRGNAAWRCFVLCSDFEITDDNFAIVKGSGKSNDDPYFEVKVAPNTKGNVIIAVGLDAGDTYSISWSWHLWITDYDPNECLSWGDGTDGQYIYPVPNGAVHRYEGGWWKNNKDIYIMDRNLGSFSSNQYPSDNVGLLYYQFGRKDPFFVASVYKYPGDKKYSFVKENSYELNLAEGQTQVSYAVLNPLTFLTGKPSSDFGGTVWTYGNKYNPSELNSSIIWQDPLTADGAANEGGKSIFDPCPPGYRVPNRVIWGDFRKNTDENFSTNAVFQTGDGINMNNASYNGGFKSFQQIKGLQYWPYEEGRESIPSEVVYIPAAGRIEGIEGNLEADGNKGGDTEYWAYLWTEEPHGKNSYQAKYLNSQPDNLGIDSDTERGRGIPVRCIKYTKQ